MEFTFARRGGYECSSKGDRRFSAFYAVMPDGRTIEEHYQCDVKGYDVGGQQWRLGKGKPPLDPTRDMWAEYLALWRAWAKINSELIEELRGRAAAHNCILSDCFASTPVNQARALAQILNETKEVGSMDEFKLIVAGGRSFVNADLMWETVIALANGPYALKDVSIVSGMAPGADRMAAEFAKMNHVVLYPMPANWKHYGRSAGMRRNADMAAFADGALVFWNGTSKGSRNMIETMRKLGKPVHVVMYDEPTLEAHRGFHQANGRFVKGL